MAEVSDEDALDLSAVGSAAMELGLGGRGEAQARGSRTASSRAAMELGLGGRGEARFAWKRDHPPVKPQWSSALVAEVSSQVRMTASR